MRFFPSRDLDHFPSHILDWPWDLHLSKECNEVDSELVPCLALRSPVSFTFRSFGALRYHVQSSGYSAIEANKKRKNPPGQSIAVPHFTWANAFWLFQVQTPRHKCCMSDPSQSCETKVSHTQISETQANKWLSFLPLSFGLICIIAIGK